MSGIQDNRFDATFKSKMLRLLSNISNPDAGITEVNSADMLIALEALVSLGVVTQYTDDAVLVTAQNTTNAYVDAGDVIDMRSSGFNSLILKLDLAINDTTGNYFKFMSCDSEGLNQRDIQNGVEELLPDTDYSQTYPMEKIFDNFIILKIKHTVNTGTTSNITASISKSFN